MQTNRLDSCCAGVAASCRNKDASRVLVPLTLTFTTASSQSLNAVLDKAAVTYWTMGGTLYFSSLSGIRIAVDERRTQ
jgi:hypothetical protein